MAEGIGTLNLLIKSLYHPHVLLLLCACEYNQQVDSLSTIFGQLATFF